MGSQVRANDDPGRRLVESNRTLSGIYELAAVAIFWGALIGVLICS